MQCGGSGSATDTGTALRCTAHCALPIRRVLSTLCLSRALSFCRRPRGTVNGRTDQRTDRSTHRDIEFMPRLMTALPVRLARHARSDYIVYEYARRQRPFASAMALNLVAVRAARLFGPSAPPAKVRPPPSSSSSSPRDGHGGDDDRAGPGIGRALKPGQSCTRT